jgi:5-methylcytosine-specific restriction protein A
MEIEEITTGAVEKAMDEFDALKREPFLAKYKIGAARGHYVVRRGRKYDAKAIVAAAHGFLDNHSPLLAAEFYGGEGSTKFLGKLGFKTVGPSDALIGRIPFEVGKLYHRQRDIHQIYGGQERGGITTPSGLPIIFLFTGESGEEFGYEDQFNADGSFSYTGEGPTGPMKFVRGNLAIREQTKNAKDLLLFEAQLQKGTYKYVGCFGCAGYEMRPGRDINGNERPIIVFKLVRTDGDAEEADIDLEIGQPATATVKSLTDLRTGALRAAQETPSQGQGAARKFYKRSIVVAAYVLARADGHCEACKTKAPFRRKDGRPYLEPHHTKRLADKGPDHPRTVAALCPACHREVHHGENGASLNESIIARLLVLEPSDD